MNGTRRRRATIAASAALLVTSLGWAQPLTTARAADPIPLVVPVAVVTIGFDDGTVDQFDTLPVLTAHGMHVLHQQWADPGQ